MNPTITSTTLVDVTGISTTVANPYSSPIEAEIELDFMILGNSTSPGFFVTINVNGTDQVQRFATAITSLWTTVTKSWFVTIPANTTVTIKPRLRVSTSGSVQIGRDAADNAYRTRILTKFLGS